MPRDGQGNYNPPLNSWNPAVDGNEADPAGWNELRDDITSALSQSVSSDGQTMMTGNLRMGGNQIQNLGQPMGNGFALRRDQLIKGSNIPSASTINIPAEGSLFEVTGTSTINQITGSFDGRVVVLVFQGALTIKHNPNLLLPNQTDITTEGGEDFIFYRRSSDVWACLYSSTFTEGALQKSANLSDVEDADVARNNLNAVNKSGDTMTGPLAVPSVLKVLAVDEALEGGEIQLAGAANHPAVTLDNQSGIFRVFGGGIKMLRVGPNTVTYGGEDVWHTGNLDPLVRGSANNTAKTVFNSDQAPSIASINSSGNSSNVPLEIGNGGNNYASAVIGFHRQGLFGAFFGLDADNQWKVGGRSMGDVAYRIWHEGNLNPEGKANAGAQCQHNSAVVEFGNVPVSIGVTDQDYTALCAAPYVMVGLRSRRDGSGNTNVWVRGITLRNQ